MKQIWQIIKYSRELWGMYALIGGFTVLLALLNQVPALLIKGIVDRLVDSLGGGELVQSELIWLVGWIFLADAGSTVISNVSGYYGDVMAIRLRRLLTLDYFNHLMRLPQAYFDSEKTGAIMNRLDRSLAELRSFMNVLANNFLQFILSTIFTLIVIAYYSWEIALLLGVLFPIFLIMTQRTSRDWQGYQAKINDLADRARARFTESVSQIKVLRAFTREQHESVYQDKKFTGIMGHTRRQSRTWHRRDVERRLVLNLIFLAVFLIIAVKGFNGSLSVGEIVLLVQYATAIRLPLFSMSFIVDNTQRAVAGSKEFFDVMALKPTIVDKPGAKRLTVAGAEVKFDNVSFSYDRGGSVLNGVGFTAEPGRKLALVGESGEGKSTIASLLLRFYEPDRGQISIDGQDLRNLTQTSLRQNIGVVFQDPSLFSGRVKDNIAFANPGVSQAKVTAAAKAANAHGFITDLPDGYDTEIGERGIKLSGGQQQRVAIARAILSNPPILLLDEATSSLDSKAEAQVQEALDRLMKGRTSIIIAHRLSTIKDVDTIVTLKGGRVDEVGSPAKLAKTEGIYAQLLNLQTASGQARKKLLKQYDLVS